MQRLSLLASLHDIGKYNLGFQNKIKNGSQPYAGHLKEARYLIAELYADHSEPSQFLPSWFLSEIRHWGNEEDDAFKLFIAAISHHGKPIDFEVEIDKRIWESSESIYQKQAIEELLKETRKWFPSAFRGSESDNIRESSKLQHYFNGLVTLADWLGSDERFFPLARPIDIRPIIFSREAASKAVNAIGMNVRSFFPMIGKRTDLTYRAIFDFDPRPVQREIDVLKLSPEGSITLIEDETGSGKTEAALKHFVNLLGEGLVDGCYFALPTRSAATQIHKRVFTATQKIFADKAPPVVLGVPGYIKVDDSSEARRLPGFEVLWPDEDRYRYRGWAAEHPKRYFVSPIIVGTIDQVLLSSLQVKHADMRASAILRLLIVFDEVHASDRYMSKLMESVVEQQLGVGGHILLMSATLGSSLRSRFFNSTRKLSYREALETPYPCIFSAKKKGGESACVAVSSEKPQKEIKIAVEAIADDSKAIAAEALNHAVNGARVLVLRNTVSDAIETQEQLESISDPSKLFQCAGLLSPHHSRFASEDRKLLDSAVEEKFGEKGSCGACIIVSTQTIEQSLDVDFDIIITDLAPMDVLLQRLGRLHRHEDKNRPSGYEKPSAVIMRPKNRDIAVYINEQGNAYGPHGIGTVYEDCLVLEATLRFLEDNNNISIPFMNRHMVEATTHTEKIEVLIEEGGSKWKSHYQKIFGRTVAKGQQALLNIINRDAGFDDRDCLFNSTAERISARLGEFDRIVRFKDELMSPFGNRLSYLTVPAHLISQESKNHDENELIQGSIEEGRIYFKFSGQQFIYDRFGLRRRDAETAGI